MAIYHCSIKNIGRSSGRSAVSCSAYRSGEKLVDKETGLVHDYTKKSGVEFTEIILCKNAPEEYKDRSTLWNEVQKIEKASDSRLAREWEVAIPSELSKEQAKELVHNFGQSLADEGMCVDVAIHWKDGNHHAHIMGTTRPIKENGEWGTKEKKDYALDERGQRIPLIDKISGEQKLDSRNRKQWKRVTVEANDWNKSEKVEEWRERWANECNKFLSQDKQIDHRSFERQGLEQIPTIHEGYAAREIERKGGISELCQQNRIITEQNKAFEKLREMLGKTKSKLNEWKEKIADELRGKQRKSATTRTNDEIDRGTTRSNVRASAEHTQDRGSVGTSGRSKFGERTIAHSDIGARGTVEEIAKYDRGMAELSRKVTETERGIASLKSELEKVRELNDKFAKFRRNVGTTRGTGQDDIGTKITEREIRISELKARETDNRLARLKRDEVVKQTETREPTFDNPGKKGVSREPDYQKRYDGPSI